MQCQDGNSRSTLRGASARLTADGSIAGTGDDTPPRRFRTVDSFVDEFLATTCWVDVTGSARIWCPDWWRHPGAVVRLDALHRAFESLRLDPALGITTWLRDHLDYHLGALTDPQGPFKGCTITKGHDTNRDRTIPTTPAPVGLFFEED
ncbi:DUF4913 domain-containing protein [Nocardioides sp. InS609-2]|uniref:DUF4913 domain-containing protein n=1 Tax=Nocardioides sp. InS609-2 TaxID=2760705 RepID=UPI0032C0DD5A